MKTALNKVGFLMGCLMWVGLLAACGTSSDELTSHELAHRERSYTNELLPWYWHQIAYEDYRKMFPRNPSVASTDNALTRRLQMWSDAFYDIVAKEAPEFAEMAPRPRILVSLGPMNATVPGVPVKHLVRLEIEGRDEGQVGETAYLGSLSPDFDSRTLSILEACTAQKPCTEGKKPESVATFAEWLNSADSSCKFSVKDEHTLVTSEAKCPNLRGRQNQNFISADSILSFATGDFITVGTRLIQHAASEEEVVAVLAHEFSHYAKAHNSRLRQNDLYRYTFDDDQLLPDRPLPAPDGHGYYSKELEADEMALELLHRVGIGHKPFVSVLFKMLDYYSSIGGIPARDFNVSECKNAYEKGWKDPATGAEIKPPIGDAVRNHHGWCYRIWWIEHEMKAHEYKEEKRTIAPADWTELVNSITM